MRDVLPPGAATEADELALKAEVGASKQVATIAKKQKASGVWGDNILGLAASKTQGIKDVGTVSQYRRLLELGVEADNRALRLAERTFYRLLSRDEDPALLFEFKASLKGHPVGAGWARNLMREGCTSALAQAGHVEDPRVRGSAHRIANDISQFLRSELVEKPLVRKGSKTTLHPEAHPPTTLSVAMLAYLPALQRERAGFVQRLCAFLAQPAPKKAYTIQVGSRSLKPVYHLLGDPIQTDAQGRAKDLPLALHWIELLVRMGMLDTSPTAPRVLSRLLEDCDPRGVWNPKNLRSAPKSASRLADFAFPLDDGKGPEARQADVTFRLALIAKLAGWKLEYD